MKLSGGYYQSCRQGFCPGTCPECINSGQPNTEPPKPKVPKENGGWKKWIGFVTLPLLIALIASCCQSKVRSYPESPLITDSIKELIDLRSIKLRAIFRFDETSLIYEDENSYEVFEGEWVTPTKFYCECGGSPGFFLVENDEVKMYARGRWLFKFFKK